MADAETCWVKLHHTDEVVLEVPLPATAAREQIKEAALSLLDSGSHSWITVDGGMEVDSDYIPYTFEDKPSRAWKVGIK